MVEDIIENKEVSEDTEIVKRKRGRPKKVKVEENKEVVEEIKESNDVKENDEQLPFSEDLEKLDEIKPEGKIGLIDNLPFPEKEVLNEEEEKNIKQIQKIEPTKEEKGFWEKFFDKKKLNKQNMVAILLLGTDAKGIPLYREYDQDGMFTVEDIKKNPLAKKYHVREDCIFTIEVKKKSIPLCILPVWSMVPLGTKIYWEMSQERRGLELQEGIIKAIRAEEIVKADENLKKKGGLSGKTIWIVIGLIVIGYLIWKGTGH